MEDEEFVDSKLHEAVRYSDIDDVRLALKEGYDPNQIGIYQWNALHEATNNGDVDIVRILLKHGADPNKCDRLKGCTAVHYAALNGFHTILKLLLDKGGTYNIVNNEGMNPLDVASGLQCQKLLRELRNNDTSFHTSKEEILNNRNQDLQLHLNNNNRNTITTHNNNSGGDDDNNRCTVKRLDSETDSVISVDPDEISIATDSSSSSRPHSRAWGPERLLGISKEQTLGTVQLSFEYNSKKKTFKIRVWKLMDLLFPPPSSSQISGVYVKSFLQPDAPKDTKQKTEEIKIISAETPEVNPNSRDFFPASFSFKQPLEYQNISRQIVAEKVIDLEVCITQRYSRKSYSIAYLSLPMHIACRKLVKEKFRLQPRIGAKLPENMKVYSALEQDKTMLTHKKRISMSMSNPSLYRQGSRSSWAVPYQERASSESNLEVLVEKTTRKVPSIEITVPNEEDEELEVALNQIAIMERAESERSQSSIEMSDFSGSIPGSLGDGFQGVEVKDPVKVAEVLVHLPQAGVAESKLSGFLGKSGFDSVSMASSGPAWDYYDEAPTFSMVPIDISEELPLPDDSGLNFDPMAPVLPVATSLELPKRNSKPSKYAPDDIEAGGGKEKKEVKKTDKVKAADRVTKMRKQDPRETTEIVEMATFKDNLPKCSTKNNESVAEVHSERKLKKRQFLKERVVSKDEADENTKEEICQNVVKIERQVRSKKMSPNVLSKEEKKSDQLTQKTERKDVPKKEKARVDEESMIGGIEMSDLKPHLEGREKIVDEESSLGAASSGQVTRTNSFIEQEKVRAGTLDLPVIHRKKRNRPKP